MTKPTGRPRGRPKTKEYVTLMARVDVALADQAQRYARLHRQTISDVLRDGLQVLLSDQDPWCPIMSDANRDAAISSDRKAAIEKVSDRNGDAAILSDTNRDTAIVSDRNGVTEEIVSDRNGDEEMMSDTKTAPAAILSDGIAVVQEDGEAAARPTSARTAVDNDYDPTTHLLGKLCPRQHEYRGSGQSVLRISNRHCRACDREKFHERKQAKRQAQRA